MMLRAALPAVFAALSVEAQWASMDGMGLVMCGNWAAKLDEMNRVCWCVLTGLSPRCRLTQTVCRQQRRGAGRPVPERLSLDVHAGVRRHLWEFSGRAFLFSSWSSPSSQSADFGLLCALSSGLLQLLTALTARG